MNKAKLADGFAVGAVHGVLPLSIWAAQFFLSYASAEVACALDWQHFTLAGLALPRLWLWTVSAVAIASLAGLTALGIRNAKAQGESAGTLATVQIGAALLALTGVLWSAVAIVFAPLCGP